MKRQRQSKDIRSFFSKRVAREEGGKYKIYIRFRHYSCGLFHILELLDPEDVNEAGNFDSDSGLTPVIASSPSSIEPSPFNDISTISSLKKPFVLSWLTFQGMKSILYLIIILNL